MDSEIETLVASLKGGSHVLLCGPDRERIHEIVVAARGALKDVDVLAIAENISAQDALTRILENGDRVLLASLTNVHLFGVTAAFIKVIESHFGSNYGVHQRLLEQALGAVRLVGTSMPGSFREKLREAKYNQAKTRDHGQLLRGWAREGERFDPGWELDR